MIKHIFFFSILLSFFAKPAAYTQIEVLEFAEPTSVRYSSQKGSDQAFIVYSDATLLASNRDSTNYSFHWYEVGLSGRIFLGNDTMLSIPSNSNSRVKKLIQLVEVFPGDTTSTDTAVYRSWVFIPENGELEIDILKDENDTLLSGINCNTSSFSFSSNIEFYFNQISDNSIDLNLLPDSSFVLHGDSIQVKGTCSNGEAYGYNFNLGARNIVVTESESSNSSVLFYEKNSFYLTYSPYGINSNHDTLKADTIHIKPKATEAILSAEAISYFDEKYESFWNDTIRFSQTKLQENYAWGEDFLFGEKSGPAPLWVAFKVDESRNASRFYLYFDDDSSSFRDTIFFNKNQTIYKLYLWPNKNNETTNAYVRTWNEDDQCENTSSSEVINISAPNTPGVEDPAVLLPNVFVYGIDNYFRTQDVSFHYIKIKIFNRNGVKVHQYEGNIQDWEGWDGHIRDRAKPATEGVYFYSIEMQDWAGAEYKGGKSSNITGFFHLFHQ
jgi:hypothetical protein